MEKLQAGMNRILPSSDQGCLVLDASAGLALGALSGLEDFEASVRPLLAHLDGLACSPGQLRRLPEQIFGGTTLLVRADWTNALRGEDHALPVETVVHFPILEPEDAADLGASGLVVSFLLGYDETVEADCLRTCVRLALGGKRLGLPLVVEVLPSGPRVSLPGKAAELGASYALESGADLVAVPFTEAASLKTIGAMLSVPWLVKPASPQSAAGEWEQARDLGAAGLWLDHHWAPAGLALAGISDLVRQVRQEGA